MLSYVLRAGALEERIETLARRTDPITSLMADLESPDVLRDSPKAELARVARLWYFGKNSKEQIARTLHVTRPIVYKRREELVKMAIGYLGL